jgi:hypothetical protein
MAASGVVRVSGNAERKISHVQGITMNAIEVV